MIEVSCVNCKKVFKDYASNNKKYCCKECYYKSLKNKKPWNKGLKGINVGHTVTEETRKKISKANKKALKGNVPWNKGLSGRQVAWNKGLKGFLAGEQHYNWKGGQQLIFTIRNCFEYRQWRSDVFTRDEFTCQSCGDNSGGNLNAHHIKHFQQIINQYRIKSIEEAVKCEELWNTNNGITLCVECHRDKHRK